METSKIMHTLQCITSDVRQTTLGTAMTVSDLSLTTVDT